jgi:metal-responsive CopG/Arc/MetJ family transcriptional regulator
MATVDARKKSMGRPRVESTEVSVRIKQELLEQIDAWRAHQQDTPGRPEAIRRLLAKTLQTKGS